MKLKTVGLTALAAAAAALVTACGGGGGSQSAVQLSGVAATGLAMANSAVDVKCASGTGTATTNESGSYTVTVTDGVMPCIVKVTGTVDGVQVTLHSVAEGGTTSGSNTTATANVTPLTEMILARAAGTLPADLFENFGSSTAGAITATLATAKTELLTALRDAVGVDFGNIDPFTDSLVAATPANPTGGNLYDQALDALGAKVSPAALPQVVSQIASTTGNAAPMTLEQVMGNVNAGSLAGCPSALSGQYRMVEYTGAVATLNINFGTNKLTVASEEGDEVVDIVPSTSQPCQFLAQGESPTTVVMGASGAGAFGDAERVGYIFPVQSHTLAAVQGSWQFVESGIEESNLGVHFVGELNVAADGQATVCEYGVMNNDFAACTPDTDETVSLQEHAGGYFVLNYGTDSSVVYAFRAPNGSLSLFGSNNPGHLTDPGTFRTHFVMTRPQTAATQAVGTTTNYWDLVQRYIPSGTPATTNGTLTATLGADSTTVTASSETSVTRVRASDDRVDTFELNQPIAGLRYRAPVGTAGQPGFVPSLYQRSVPGTELVISIDALANFHLYAISVGGRPAAAAQ